MFAALSAQICGRDMADSLPYYTTEEVAEHKTQENGVWVAIDGNVYDVTQFLEEVRGDALY